MSIFESNPHYFGNVGNHYKFVKGNVGCEVSRPMTDPQPTSKGNSTESQKPLENFSSLWQLIADILNNCSKETRQEFSEQLKEEAQKRLDEYEGDEK